MVEWQIEQGINGLVPCGTTGEAPTLSWEERLDVIVTCVKTAGGRVPVIAGTGTNGQFGSHHDDTPTDLKVRY